VVTPADELWSARLPLEPKMFGQDQPTGSGLITYGDYFSAARHFLSANNMKVVRLAIQQLLDATVAAAAIDTIRVNLLKHGAFYHPAQVRVTMGDHQLLLVLNVAVSGQGRQCLPVEYANLERLNQEITAGYLPRVFGQGQGATPAGERLPMFCGQWLQGYYEFHLTRGLEGNASAAVLWDTDAGCAGLDSDQINTVMEGAARILARYFNPITCEAIMDWHHGAGDFVVRTSEDHIDVALITVRRYAGMIALDTADPGTLLNTWLVFLVNISLRLRLDRLDGVGEPACFGNETVAAICRGFWRGLDASFQARGLPADLLDGARDYFSRIGTNDLLDVAQALAGHLVFQPAEADLLKSSLASHVRHLKAALARD
jgi:hypothetical protein